MIYPIAFLNLFRSLSFNILPFLPTWYLKHIVHLYATTLCIICSFELTYYTCDITSSSVSNFNFGLKIGFNFSSYLSIVSHSIFHNLSKIYPNFISSIKSKSVFSSGLSDKTRISILSNTSDISLYFLEKKLKLPVYDNRLCITLA